MAEVGSAFVSVVPSARGFGASLNNQVSGETTGVGKKVGRGFGAAFKLGAVAVLGGAAVLGGFLKGAFSEAREAQKVGALTNAVIKSTGGVANVTAKHVDSLASSISLKTGVDDEAIASGENMLLTFSNVRNEVGKGNKIFDQATVAASDMAAAFGGDATSNSKMLGKALNDPTKGVSALTRVGVSFTQQQKDQIKKMQESGNLLGAQKIILGEVSKQTKGAAEATATMGDKAKVAFGNLQESVGTALLPLWDKLLGGATKFFIFLTNNIGPGIASLNGYLAPAVAAVQSFFSTLTSGSGSTGGFLTSLKSLGTTVAANVLPVLRTMATTFTTLILPALKSFGAYVIANVLPILQQIATIFITKVLPIIAQVAQFIYGQLVPAIVKIVTSIAGSLRPVFDALFAQIQKTVLPIVTQLLAKFREWWPTISKVIMIVLRIIGVILRLAAAILGKVLPPLITFAGFLIRNVVTAILGVIGVLVKIIAKIIDFGKWVVDGGKKIGEFAGKVKDGADKAVGYVKDLPGKAKDALGDLADKLKQKGKDLIQGLIDGILDKLKDLGKAMGKIGDKIKGFLPGSPIKEGPLVSWNGGGAGKRLVDQGIISGLDSRGTALSSSMTRLTRRISVPRVGIDSTVGSSAALPGGSGGNTYNLHEVMDASKAAREIARYEAFAGGS